MCNPKVQEFNQKYVNNTICGYKYRCNVSKNKAKNRIRVIKNLRQL